MSRPGSARLAALAAGLACVGVGAGAGCGQAGAGPGGGGGQGEPVTHPTRSDGAQARATGPRAVVDRPVEWLKGSTHVHTIQSGDSTMAVDAVVRWYGDHGYDFIVITDHNRVTEFDSTDRPLVLRGVEFTHNPASCDPPPPEPEGRCRIHLNGIGVTAPAPPSMPNVPAAASVDLLDVGARPQVIEWKNHSSNARVDMYQAGIDKIREMGGIAQINHPSWHWGVSGELLAELGRRGAVLVEIANMGFARWNLGTPAHPSAEALWDVALGQGVLLYGVASDDAHQYLEGEIAERNAAGKPVYQAGTGWVMVHAARSPDAIRRALERGDFYATTGVVLERVELVDGALAIDVAAASTGAHEISFVGQGGAVLARSTGTSARYPLERARSGYVRAVITRDDGARAWVQPVWVPRADPPPAAP
ncbi:MAG TPA: hypothetical protein VK698_08895 [Kofleriaceae bacterium]|nr:hypothetical protein [Kofleriaceae bacterium]